jgi:hypothetical protein
MALFGNKRRSQADSVDAPQRRRSMFGRNRSVSPTTNGTAARNGQKSGGLFNRHRSASPTTTGSNGHGLLHRHQDPAVHAAHQRVLAAETAERDADRALLSAKTAVKQARLEVQRLEKESAAQYVTVLIVIFLFGTDVCKGCG